MRFLQAKTIFNGATFEPDGRVLVIKNDGTIMDIIGLTETSDSNIERLEGVLCPGFVNVHCHLELSHLKGKIPEKEGFIAFARNIIKLRHCSTAEEISDAAVKADEEMKNNGIALVGDISNTTDSFSIKSKSKIQYHTFIELLALKSELANDVYQEGVKLLNQLTNIRLKGSLAPHAPYSCSNSLIQKIQNYNLTKGLPFSIHNQESEEENKFLQGKSSAFEELYTFLNTDITWFKPSFSSSFNAYSELLKGNKNILVHNTYMYPEDIQSLNTNFFLCLCPNANLYIENTLPNFELLNQSKARICFGTDSLASNHHLNILSEANIFLNATGNLLNCLQALCTNGAQALGMEEYFGRFNPNTKPGINLIDINKNQIILKQVIH